MQKGTDTTDSAHTDYGFCFACERFIGTSLTCPYCGERAILPKPILWMRRCAWIIAASGIFFLWLAARQYKPEHVYTADISQEMNYARVVIKGILPGKPFIRSEMKRIEYASFAVNDGTGEIRVILRGTIAEQAILPEKGSTVEVIGRLYQRIHDAPRLILENPGDLRSIPPAE